MKAYVVQNPQGHMIVAWLRLYAKDSKELCAIDCSMTWKELYKMGYRCLKITVQKDGK